MAPEMLKKPPAYGVDVDMWAVGVLTYILLSGSPPFYHDDDAELDKVCLAGKYEWDPADFVSDLAKDFVSKLLVVDPEKRLTATEALEHEWVQGHGLTLHNHDEEFPMSPAHTHLRGTQEKMKKFNQARRRFGGAIDTIRATRRLSNGKIPAMLGKADTCEAHNKSD
eukprot:TRINITY_DN9421_c0_g1_i1.p1 TRINITY_DN9421_c0_g1~~TRINITY_DN9421_c0_g1_i1.p1  ORF type:complete len:167 (-),score=30.73 TRINITY_DN9421_c0_g1_i1:185-685(-)